MEENKKCCEGSGVENKCGCCIPKMCCGMKKCRGMKVLFFIILLVISFHVGTQWGELKSEVKGGREFRGGMMDWNYKVVRPATDDKTQNTPVAPTTPAPTLKQ